MYTLKVRTHFDAAHYLKNYIGKCHRTHGHRWDVEIAIQGDTLDSMNMLVDFSIVKRSMKQLIDETLDHYSLNDTLKEPNPTAEFIAKWIYEHIPLDEFASLLSVTVWESPECSVCYEG